MFKKADFQFHQIWYQKKITFLVYIKRILGFPSLIVATHIFLSKSLAAVSRPIHSEGIGISFLIPDSVIDKFKLFCCPFSSRLLCDFK